MLNLAEELLLLALEDEKGVVHSAASSSLDYGLAGAVLMELVLADRLRVEGERVLLDDGSLAGDEVLDGALEDLGASKPRTAEHWVGRWGRQNLKDRLLERLVRKGVLRREEHRVLWIFPQNRYPERDAASERALRERVRAVVLGGHKPEARLAALTSLIKACDLADEVFAPSERDRAHKRLEEMAEKDLVGNAVSDTVDQVQAATQAAVMASVTAATAASAASCSTTSATC